MKSIRVCWLTGYIFVIFSGIMGISTSFAQENKYIVKTIVLPDGRVIEASVYPSPPDPPYGIDQTRVVLPEPNSFRGMNTIPDVPAFNWSFGCSATAAAMIAGYYDRTGYSNIYTGPTNGGVMPLDNSAWPDWVDTNGDTRHQCPLSATHNGLDGRTENGHVDDYWIFYGEEGPDPWDGNWAEHTYGECTGDFMKTNQWIDPAPQNIDGGTMFYNFTNGAPLSWEDMEDYDIHDEDGGYGFKLFYESRGYTVADMYNQHRLGYDRDGDGTQYEPTTQGFTYDQYKAEIDAGRPVMIHVVGHTMVGIGYDDTNDELMYIHNTWNYNTYTMIWGEEYSGMMHTGVTIVQLDEVEIVKGPYLQNVTPTTMTIMWETDDPAGGQVDFGTTTPDSVSVDGAASVEIHEVQLIGLTPDKTYYYTVTSDGATSATYTFSTAPATERNFRFVAYGDTRTGSSDHAAVVQSIINSAPEFVLNTGDLVNLGKIYSEWKPQFFDPAHDLMVNTPLFPILGNHEYSGGGSTLWFKEFFSLPDNGELGYKDEWFAFSYSNTRFIGLNTNADEPGVDYSEGSDQYNWLVNEFGSDEYQEATWHIVFFHHPPYTATENHSDDELVKAELVPLFELYGVDMVFNGHSHAYERYYHNCVNYIVTGGGGAPLRDLEPHPGEPFREEGASVYHHCVIDVDVPTQSLTLSVRNTSDVEFDDLTLYKHAVVFVAEENGSITGPLEQKVNHGCNSTEVEAVADAGYHFTGWTGDYTGTENPLTITNVTSDMTIAANFAVNTITVSSPNGGENLLIGTTHDITWTSQGNVGNVMIEYSFNNGSSWNTIIASTANSGSYFWNVPADKSTNCLVRISEAVTGVPVDVSDAVFTIRYRELDIPLNSGWSIVSFNMDPISFQVSDIFADVASLVLVKNNAAQVYMPDLIDDIGQITIQDGYKVYTTEIEDLTVEGLSFNDYTNIPMPLSAGWDMIAYLPEIAMPVEDALFAIRDHITIVKDNIGGTYMPDFSINTIGDMVPGKGYKIHMKTDQLSFTYPSSEFGQAKAQADNTFSQKPLAHFTFTENTGNNMTVIVQAAINPLINGTAIENSDEIGVFTTAGLCVGGAVWNGANSAITVWGDDNQTPVVDGITAGDTLRLRLWDASADLEYVAAVTYTSGNPDYSVDGISVLATCESAQPITVTVTTPNGGETARIGEVFDITWTNTGFIGDVLIEYTHDNGANWTTIADDVSNTGSYLWTVPATLSATCKVRVSEASDSYPADESDNVFTIDNATSIGEGGPKAVQDQFVAVPNPVDFKNNEHIVSFIFITEKKISSAGITIFDAVGNLLVTLRPVNLQVNQQGASYALGSWNPLAANVSPGSFLAVLNVTENDGKKHVLRTMIGVKK